MNEETTTLTAADAGDASALLTTASASDAMAQGRVDGLAAAAAPAEPPPPATTTVEYTDGTSATGPGTLPNLSPDGAERVDGIHNAVNEVERARMLPFLRGQAFQPVTKPGCIENFMDEDADGNRTLARIVVDAAGKLCKEHAPQDVE